MSPLSQKSSSYWRAALLLGLVTFASSLYFYEGGGWNQNSRFDLLRAIVERHTLQIDAYHENTQDKAHFHGHYYSDKAPGLVFLAVPMALAARPVLRVAGVDPESARGELALSYFVSAGAVALPTALAAVCLFFLSLRFGSSISGAAFGAVVMALATPMWAYASLFWAHALVGACLIFALAAALKLRDSSTARRDFFWALAVGLAAGWATVTEYPAAPASAMLAALALSQAWPRGREARWRVTAGVGVGAAICVIVLLAYLYAAFGSIRPSYSYYDPNSFSFMQRQGYMGLTYPHPDRLLKILFGCSRGLFFAAPVLLAAPYGLWRLWKEKTYSAAALVASAIVAYYFLFNASFYWWKAGLSFGPRYAGAAIPFLCVGLGIAVDACDSALANRAGSPGCDQRLCRVDGDFNDVTVGNARQLSSAAFGVAGLLVRTNGAQSRFDVDRGRGRIARPIWSVQSWTIGRPPRPGEPDSATADLVRRGAGVVALASHRRAEHLRRDR